MIRRLLLPLLAALLALVTLAAAAAGQGDPVDETLDGARTRIDAMRKQLAGADAAELPGLRADALSLQQRTVAVAADLAPQLANVEARQAELGTPPAPPAREAADVAAQRAELIKQRARIDAQLRLARLLAIEGEQLAEQLAGLRRQRFEAALGERTQSVLAPAFWAGIGETRLHDAERLADLRRELAAAARAVPAWAWTLAAAVVLAASALLPRAQRWLLRIATTRVPPGRLRRSLLALGRALLLPAAVLLAANVLRWTLLSGGAATPAVDSLLFGVGGAIAFGTYVGALGRALMAPSRPSWRLPPLPDALALRLRRDPVWLGLAVAALGAIDRLTAVVDTALATSVGINALFSLLLAALLLRTLRRGERVRRELLASTRADQVPPRPLPALAMVVAGWGVLVVSVAGLLLGYVALGNFLVKQVAWLLIVAASAWLLAAFVDDACMTWLGAAGADDAAQGTPPTLRRQAAVLLSAALRLVIVLVALALVVGPLGQGPSELLQRAGSLRSGLTVGEIHVAPGAVAQALLVLAAGIFAVRALQRWLLERYLPTTGLDPGMRSSTATLLGYVGMVFAVALSLSALGLGLERVAWVASALSVGIGFGLQAVVSNFVSGLILLTERPVKVGDWVAVSGVEGDIRRINVRATEIQMGDRSTVIVPNSEFITKIVRNVTHGNASGLVQIRLVLPLDADVLRVRELLLAVLRDDDDVLEAPAPGVLLDAVESAGLAFVATGSVASPRQVGAVRSALLFEMLARLKAAGIGLGRPATLLLRDKPGAEAA